MKQENDKTIRVLLKTGQFLTLYMDQSAIDILKSKLFLQARDDGNTVWVAPEALTAFEVLDDRKETEVQTDTPLEPATV